MTKLKENHKDIRDRKPLLDFLTDRRVMNLATVGNEGPYSTPVFYAVADHGETLLFMSKTSSSHSQHISLDPRAGASVYMVTGEFGKTQGAQLTGIVELLEGSEKERARKIYLRKHRLAILKRPLGNEIGLYAFRVHHVKMTDNRFGFGRPRIWEFNTH